VFRESNQLEQRAQQNGLLLVLTGIVSTLGLAVAVSPLLTSEIDSLWPWPYTSYALLAGLSIAVAVLSSQLAKQQWRITALRKQPYEMRGAELERANGHANALARANDELNVQITERQRVEHELRSLNDTLEERVVAAKKSLEVQSEHLRELYRTAHQFVDNVSHEFRTPLTVIREYACVMRDGLTGTTDDDQRECLDTIIARVDDLVVMVNDLLDISRIEADILRTSRRPHTVTDIFEHVRDTLERKAARHEIDLEIATTPEALPLVYCDKEKIGRVVVNLTVNAIKFSNPGNTVRLWARPHDNGSEVVLGVTDHGPGIAAEDLECIFERFKQLDGNARASTKGFGLGLNIVRELVQLNFGEVYVESEPGEGSTFSFTIPLSDPKKLLPVYLTRVQQVRSPAEHASLLTVAIDATAPDTKLEQLEQFLNENTRRTDLVFGTRPGSWLLVALTDGPGTEHMINRLNSTLAETNSTRQRLPTIRWSLVGTWCVKDHETFLTHFLAASEAQDHQGDCATDGRSGRMALDQSR
jgi:signal transduction histidine kinase